MAKKKQNKRSALKSKSSIKKSPIKILIVEDEQLVALDVRHYLEKMSYRIVGIAPSGKEALEIAQKNRPDLVLMDIVLKGALDGIETARQFKLIYDIPSIFLTAYADEEKIERAKVAQPFGYILKPFNKNELKVAIEMAHHKHKLDQEILDNQKKLKHGLKEKEVMLKEIHHRVKNNMQLISSLLSLQSSRIKDKLSISVLEESQHRIRSMMLIHENLYSSRDFTNIDFSKYIKQLAGQLYISQNVKLKDVQMKIDVKGVLLNMNRGIPCGLIVNELITNAFKYAFPKSKKKKKSVINLSMIRVGKKIRLIVSDNGVGLSSSIHPEKSRSLGFQLVSTLVHQLEGTLTVSRNAGTTFTILFKD